MNEVSEQREYYAETAKQYDQMHSDEPEHEMAILWLISALKAFSPESLLDVGAGTGRLLLKLKNDPELRNLRVIGVEPVEELREQARQKGIPSSQIVHGDITNLLYDDKSFDFVTAFGVLHHVKDPSKAVGEMLRVAKMGVFISDMNNFGCGNFWVRSAKQLLNCFGLWPFVQFLKTKGRKYKYSEGDGIHYSYSLYNNFGQISKACSPVHVLNTKGQGVNPYRTCSHIAILGIKKEFPQKPAVIMI